MSQRDKISVSNRIVDLKMSALYFFYDCEASSSGLHSDIIEVAVRCDPDVLDSPKSSFHSLIHTDEKLGYFGKLLVFNILWPCGTWPHAGQIYEALTSCSSSFEFKSGCNLVIHMYR